MTGLRSLRSSHFRGLNAFRRISNYTSANMPPRFVPAQLDNVEDVESYTFGGLHPITIGNCFADGRYRVIHKLGYGGSSTVWLGRDQGGPKPGRLVTLKALRSDTSSESSSELTVRKILQTASPPVTGIQTVDDHFFVDGPNGSHLFIVSPFAGPSMSMMLESLRREGNKRLRVSLARKVILQLVTTVNSMHRLGVVHGDITPSNILFCLKPHVLEWTDAHIYSILGKPTIEKVTTRDGTPLPPCVPAELTDVMDNTVLTHPGFLEENVILSDFGQSYAVKSRPSTYAPGTLPNYFPPEARFEGHASFEADVWALGCSIFEIYAGFPLFSSFFSVDSEILKQTVELLGRLPDPWWQQFVERTLWFSDDGLPKSIQDQESAGASITASKTSIREKLRSIGMRDATPLSEERVELIGDLLERMLRYRPEDRIEIHEVIKHPWLSMSD